MAHCSFNSCNTGMGALPEIYAQQPQARGLKAYISGKALCQILLHAYHSEVRMIILGVIPSSEGTMQRHPLVCIYALAVIPLICDLKSRISEFNR